MHLLNYLGHFPLGSGATQLPSSVHELNSIVGDHIDEVKQANALSASNIQVCHVGRFSVDNSVKMFFNQIVRYTC